jgi:8-oxo-dGTP pyrophosphatase MutT (NUDIX family)
MDDRERSAKEQAVAFLDRLPRPLEAVDPAHVTASAVVVGRRGVLLHRHRKLGRWMQPGGHLDPAEEPAEAAVRECREETGLSVTHPWGEPRLVHLDVHAAAAGHVHIDLRYLVAGPDAPPQPEPGESPEVAWVSWDEAEALADEALAGALSVARAIVERGELPAPAREPG